VDQSAAPSPSVRPKGEFHIPSLDGLRAISFLIVFVAHAGFGDVIPGGFGVTVFFFLSGYLITTLMRMEFARSGTVSLRDFYLRRVLRILPPFYTVLLFALLLQACGMLPGQLELGAVLAQFGHITNYWTILHGPEGVAAGTGVYWSLAVEEHFYFVFPCIFLLLQQLLPKRATAQARLLLALCLAVFAWRLFLVFGLHTSTDRTYMGSDTRVDSILYGCALAVAGNPMLDRPGPATALWRRVLLPLGLAGLVFAFVYRAPWFRETLRYTLQGLALMPVFVVAMRDPQWLPFRWLNRRAIRHAGALSYSLYLVHDVLIYAVHEALPAVHAAIRGVLALALAFGLAQAMHVFIEKPFARMRKRLGHSGASPITAPESA
jgi:peptidoglycan/LPS O-acetylase OafA/YrhL